MAQLIVSQLRQHLIEQRQSPAALEDVFRRLRIHRFAGVLRRAQKRGGGIAPLGLELATRTAVPMVRMATTAPIHGIDRTSRRMMRPRA